MEYTFLEHLNDQRDNWSIKVRIVRMCPVYTTQSEDEPISLDMILLDEKDTPLHATIKKELLSNFKNSIQEGDIYNITNLKISPANDSYRPIVGTKKALFLTTTIITKIQDPQITIQNHYFEFTSFKSLPQRLGDKVNLTDIIGTLHAVGHEEQVFVVDKPTKILRLEIKMHGGEIIKVTLWRNIVADFQNLFVHHKLHDGPKIVAVTSTTVKKFRDDYSINSTSTTRVYINLDIPEFNMFSQSESSQSKEDEVREIPPQDFSYNTPEKRMVRNRTTLKHIMAMKWESNVQERVFTICATINEIDYKFGWNYIGCENCLTKLTQQGQQYNCPSCDMTSKYPAPRFKIQLRVSDETATTTFTMFDKEAQKLLNSTATQLLEKFDNMDRPSTLQNLCNRKLIFEIRLSDKNLKEGSQTYTITRTFVPANIFPDPTNSTHIKQEPNSPQPPNSNSNDKEDIKQKCKIHEEVKYGDEDNDQDKADNPLSKGKIKVQQSNKNIQISSSDEDTIKTTVTKKKKIMVENITSSDEEPILLHTLRRTKKKKPKEKQSGGVMKLINPKKSKKY